ncbi:MAG: exo-beta-N-acetylmuramidase NamZ family protein, partial [Flavobacteriaceae bacterium]
RKPNTEQLKGLDILVFDIQDVGARFYTYISTLHYVMEAAAENNIKLIVLDRPNPNGHYVDGPIRKTELKSFVGMHPIPIVHGMTIGEYALMINGQGWLDNKLSCDLKIIKMKNYDRKIVYNTPLKPSPNLPNTKSINLYPSLCLFEGTNVSIGRGTNSQFQIIGNPDWKQYNFSFTPVSMPGAKFPKHKDIKCFGIDLKNTKRLSQINLKWILEAYNVTNNKEEFFSKGFDRLAGNYELRKQIKEGKTEKEIKLSWKEDIQKFKKVRSKYLLY